MEIKPFRRGTPLRFKELKAGMKVLVQVITVFSGDIFKIKTIERTMAPTVPAMRFGSDVHYVKFEGDKKNYPYWGDTIYPLTKRAKAELLLKGEKA